MGTPQTTPIYIDHHEGGVVRDEAKGIIFANGEAPHENKHPKIHTLAVYSECVHRLHARLTYKIQPLKIPTINDSWK